MNTTYAQHLPEEWHMVTSVFAALGDSTRQKIIMLFQPGEELAIKDIAAQFDLGRTTVVHHLTVLYSNGILSMRRKGRETLYAVEYGAVLEAVQKMQLFMEDSIWATVGAKARSESQVTADDGLLFVSDNDNYYDDDLEVGETTLLFVHEEDDDGTAKP